MEKQQATFYAVFETVRGAFYRSQINLPAHS
jgi:hypothetical protein